MTDIYSIYPKQFRTSKIPVERDKCFVLMPFAKQYDCLYESIKKELLSMKMICYRDDEIIGPQPFMNKVITGILKSRFVIVVLTDYRPNVLYELGITHCYKDVQNVLLLIEKDSSVSNSLHNNVSDISHLTYIEYDLDKLDLVGKKIHDFIEKGKSSLSFQEFLYDSGLLPVVTENNNDFITDIEQQFGELFFSLIDLLTGKVVDFSVKSLIINKIRSLLYSQIDNNGDFIDIYLKIFAEAIIAINDNNFCSLIIYDYLNDQFIRVSTISENRRDQLHVDFVVYLANKGHFIEIIMPWIIQYFSRTKSSAIDLNRYKLETFLVTSSNHYVNETICNALREKDFHIREHLSDIIGEKKLRLAYNILCAQLEQETSYYAGKSMIVALGKIGENSDNIASKCILTWLGKNIHGIISSEQSFVNSILTKSRNALLCLDATQIEYFDKRYSKYIKNTI